MSFSIVSIYVIIHKENYSESISFWVHYKKAFTVDKETLTLQMFLVNINMLKKFPTQEMCMKIIK